MNAIPTTPISLYNLAAATTLLLCDIIDTLPREVVYIWSYHRKTNWITLFYIITRYLPCATLVSFLVLSGRSTFLSLKLSMMDFDKISGSLFQFSILYNVPWIVMLLCTELLFIKRTAALHSDSDHTLILRILIAFFIIEMLATIILFIFSEFYAQQSIIMLPGFDIDSGFLAGYPPVVLTTPVSLPPNVSPSSYYGCPELVFQAILVAGVEESVF